MRRTPALPLARRLSRRLLPILLGLPVGALAQPAPSPAEAAPASGAALAAVAPTVVAPTSPTRPMQATPFRVGKWPEGVVATAGAVWVAQSGVRTVGRVDPKTGKVTASVKIGRLPVALAAAPDGAVMVQVNTDKQVKRIDPKTRRVKRLARLPDDPSGMGVAGDFAYVLLWQGGRSAGSSVLQIDLRTGKTRRSDNTGKNAGEISVAGDTVWVLRWAGVVERLDAATLQPRGRVDLGQRASKIAALDDGAFVGAGQDVLRLSGATVTHRQPLGGAVEALGAWHDGIIAVTDAGVVWLLDPATLAVRAQLTPPAPFRPRAMARDGQTLWMTQHGWQGDDAHGTLWRVSLERSRPVTVP